MAGYSVRMRRFARRGLRSLGTVISATPKTKHREVHSPEGVAKMGLFKTLRSNFAEVHSPEGVILTSLWGLRVKKGSASVLASGPSTIA